LFYGKFNGFFGGFQQIFALFFKGKTLLYQSWLFFVACFALPVGMIDFALSTRAQIAKHLTIAAIISNVTI